MKYILMDVEGTTTSISFVHDVLFPYSYERLKSYIETHLSDPAILNVLDETKNTVREEENLVLDQGGLIEKLLGWIKADRKHPALKKVQGLIWKEGYSSGELKGHVYEDVPLALKKWKEQGQGLGIYSSGSIEAQKVLFTYSIFGDLNSLFSNNFDTGIGHKRDSKSYQNILVELKMDASDVLFLSDMAEELDAAKVVGMQTMQLVRQGIVPHAGHLQVRSFSEIQF
ncbi:MAG: acireductone synthase [Bacteriovorax sp.]